jgi:hypothetical protein
MARPRPAGLSGAALTVGALGLYLAYAGVRDVPLVEGLRSLLRGQVPAGAKSGPSWSSVTMADIARGEGDSPGAPQGALGDSGISGLKGNAALAYPLLKAAWPQLHFGGYRPTGSVPGSRHPRGLAIDISGGVFSQGPSAADATAQRILAVFKNIPGARCWIWNRHSRCKANGWELRPYNGPSPHTDHVHVDWEG